MLFFFSLSLALDLFKLFRMIPRKNKFHTGVSVVSGRHCPKEMNRVAIKPGINGIPKIFPNNFTRILLTFFQGWTRKKNLNSRKVKSQLSSATQLASLLSTKEEEEGEEEKNESGKVSPQHAYAAGEKRAQGLFVIRGFNYQTTSFFRSRVVVVVCGEEQEIARLVRSRRFFFSFSSFAKCGLLVLIGLLEVWTRGLLGS